MRSRTHLALACLLFLFPAASNADDDAPAEPDTVAIPDELQDPAFDIYVRPETLRDAWEQLNPAALADAGLKLAQGEKILFRSHKMVKAEYLLRLAIRVAVDSRDEATLKRLADACGKIDEDRIAATAKAGLSLIASSRAPANNLENVLESLPPAVLTSYQAMLRAVKQARLRGDAAMLDDLAAAAAKAEVYPPALRKIIADRVQAAKSNGLKPGSAAEALSRLSSPSRGTLYWRFRNYHRTHVYLNSGSQNYVVKKGALKTLGGSVSVKFISVTSPAPYAGAFAAPLPPGSYRIIGAPTGVPGTINLLITN